MELYLTPKPGLVDLADRGSHPDLSVSKMEQSIRYVSDFLKEIVCSLANGEPFIYQKNLGIKAEQRLYEQLGTNTHKGYIFLSSMLLIARWHAASADENNVRDTLMVLCSSFFESAEEKASNGHRVRKKFNAGGIVLESINGFPSLFEEALPAFRTSVEQHGCFHTASFAMLARLMQTVEDTTTLHRAGPTALARVRQDGYELEQIATRGGDCVPYLKELNRVYVETNITIGGVADMLGLAYGYLIASGEISEEFERSLGLGRSIG